jgi:hypothetical protein
VTVGDHDPQSQDGLGSLQSPSGAVSIQTVGHDVQDRSLDDPGGDRAFRFGIGAGVWQKQCHGHAVVLRELTGVHEPLGEQLPVSAAVVVLGIVIVADWLASREEFIAARLPAPGWSASRDEVRAHWHRAAAEAVRCRNRPLGC